MTTITAGAFRGNLINNALQYYLTPNIYCISLHGG